MRHDLAALAIAVAATFAGGAARAGEFVDTAWRNEEGLPQATVNAIAETPEGYIWAATEAGLARFDGQRFETFDTRPSIGCQTVTALAVQRSGALAIGTKCGVLFAEDGRLTSRGARLPEPRANPLTAMVLGEDGTLWVGTASGVGRVVGDRVEMLPIAAPPNVAVLSPARGGGVWVGAWGAVGRVDSAGAYTLVAHVHGDVRAIEQTRDGSVWVAEPDGLRRLEGGALADDPRVAAMRGKDVLSLHEGPDGKLYIGLEAGDGLHVLDGAGTRMLWRPLRVGVATILVDRVGGILYGTHADGLHRLDRPLFRVVDLGPATREPAWSAYPGPAGDVWVGSRLGLLHVPAEGDARLVATGPAARTDVLSVLRMKDGVVWAGMRDRLLHVEPSGAVRELGVKDGLPGLHIGGMLQDHAGRVWVGTVHGLARLEGDRFVGVAPERTRIYELLEPSPGELWVAAENGLHILRDGAEVSQLGVAEGLPESMTTCLAQTRLGVLAGGPSGVALVREGRVVGSLHKAEGLLADEILGVHADGRGRVWYTTDFGIASVSEDELDAYFAHKISAVASRSFGTGDGLPVIECNGGSSTSIAALPNGDIVFPTMRGLVRFNPSNVGPPPAPARAIIDGVRLPDGNLYARLARRLTATERNLRFEFTAVALAAPSRVRFVRQLEGFDPAPSDPTAERAAYYTNLPPGRYRFRVRGCDVEGVCEPDGVVFPVDLAPRFHERRGFWPALALGIVALAGLAFVRRTGQLRAGARELRARVGERTRELARANADLKNAFRAAAQAQAAVEALLEEIPLPIFVYREGKLRYVNAAGCTLLSAVAGDLVGTTTGAEWRAGPEVALTTKDGGQILAEIWRSPFVWTGEPADLVIARDVTEARQLALRAATNERLAAIGTLAAGVAHEINNPLTYVAANLQHVQALLRGAGGLADAQESLAEAVDGARRIATIVKGLTTVARASDDRIEAVDLAAVVNSALMIAAAGLRPRARTEIQGLAGLPSVRGDATRLGQVVLNLVTNAAQSFPEDNFEANLVTITGAREGADMVRIEVADNGGGIPRAILPKIFNPFFTTKPVGEGTGLGLSVCHGIVRAFGGDITVKSEVGVGTTVTVTLPIWDGDAAQSGAMPSRRPGARAKVLVIDDDPRVARAIGRSLRAYAVTLAPSAEDGLARIHAGERFDLVLCDLMMPGMDGLGFHAALERAGSPLLPSLVFMTGGVSSNEISRFLETCTVPCVQKPIDVEAIDRLVRARVGRTVPPSGAAPKSMGA